MKHILACSTAHSTCSVALFDHNGLVSYQEKTQKSSQAESLFGLIDHVLDGGNYRMLDALAINIGPGSFTGIRVGLAALKGIALVTGLPLIGITSLEALAYHAYLQQAATVLAAIDAGRGQYYGQYFDQMTASTDPLLYANDGDINADYVIGNAKLSQYNGTLIPHANGLPTAKEIGQKAVFRLKNESAIITEHNAPLLPLYVRPPDAKKMTDS